MFYKNKEDPLLRIFLDKYNLNLLAIPREESKVGDLYVFDGKRVSTPGSITYFLDPPMKISGLMTGEKMADITGQITNSASIEASFGFLEGFLSAMGASVIITKIRASYEAKGAKMFRFRFSHAVRDSIDVMRIGRILMTHSLLESHALYSNKMRYYLVTAVARSKSISVIAENEKENQINIDLDFVTTENFPLYLSVDRSSNGEITYSGTKSLAFGVELYELLYDEKKHTLKLALPSGAIQVRALPKPVFINENGDYLLT